MGDKIESKKLAQKAGVNVVPGYLDDIATTDEAVKIAKDIGYPVMMKASAGGGGKGMRLAWSEKDVREGFEATKREGLTSFGDDRVFIEKFIEEPRHIEIQVLGDQHGNILYLGERECSIQRRHQKVVEEAPSPFVTPEMRKAMGEQAVALARAVGYYSAGTVELIVSGADTTGKSFYFLEMNTRLQVEHPVTEEVTGLDLVEQMIRVAAGEKLKFKQDDVKLNGWAVENAGLCRGPVSRVPAEHRAAGPLSPVTARSATAIVVRVDDGVDEGGEVSMFYDPMIAKLITWAPTREAAIDAQVAALDAFEIDGIGHNVDFLSALMQHPRFRAGNITTDFIAEEYPEGFEGAPADAQLIADLAAIAAMVETTREARAAQIDGQLGDATSNRRASTVVKIGGESSPRAHRALRRRHAGERRRRRAGRHVRRLDAGAAAAGRRPSTGASASSRSPRRAATGSWPTRGATHKVQVLDPHVAELSRAHDREGRRPTCRGSCSRRCRGC